VTSLTRTVFDTLRPAFPPVSIRPLACAMSGPNGPRPSDRQPAGPDARDGIVPGSTVAGQAPGTGRKSGPGEDGGARGADARSPGHNRMWRMFVL
jgi:hypothetical protein